MNTELRNSGLSADEVLEIGNTLNIDLFGTALDIRCKELGIEHLPEGYVRDRIMPTAEDFADGKRKNDEQKH